MSESKSIMAVESVQNLPLSPSMRALLALLVLAIDQRTYSPFIRPISFAYERLGLALVQSDASPAAASSTTAAPSSTTATADGVATCTTCGGLGFVSCASESASDTEGPGDSDDDDDDEMPELSPPDNEGPPTATSFVNVDNQLAQAILQPSSSFSNTIPTNSLSPTSSNLVPADVKAAVLAAMANTPAVAPAIAVAAGQGVNTAGASQLPAAPVQPVIPAQPSAPGPYQPSAPAGVDDEMPPLLTEVPGPSLFPAGFHSMSGVPAPRPENAVYTDING